MSSTSVVTSTSSPSDDEAHERRLLLARRRLAVEGRDHQEVAPVERAGPERRPGEHQQTSPGVQRHVAELRAHPLAGAVDRDDGGAVPAAEAHLLQGGPDQRGARRDDRLVEAPVQRRPGGREVALLGGRQPPLGLEVEDARDVAGEGQPVAGREDLVGSHRRDAVPVALHLHQVHALEVAQARLGDGAARDAGLVCHHQLEGELAGVASAVSLGDAALRQQHRDEHDHQDHGRATAKGRPTLPISNKPIRGYPGVLEQARHHEVGGGADQRDGAADDRREAHGHEVARRRAARPAGPRHDARGSAIATIGVLLRNADAAPWARRSGPARRARRAPAAGRARATRGRRSPPPRASGRPRPPARRARRRSAAPSSRSRRTPGRRRSRRPRAAATVAAEHGHGRRQALHHQDREDHDEDRRGSGPRRGSRRRIMPAAAAGDAGADAPLADDG